MLGKTDLDYKWSAQYNRELYNIYVPNVKLLIIATNANPALIKAVYKTFLDTIALLC
jgi:hypothetical protein